jgi:hypothetical protein
LHGSTRFGGVARRRVVVEAGDVSRTRGPRARQPGECRVGWRAGDRRFAGSAWFGCATGCWDAARADGARTLEAKEVLERALERPGGRMHPALVHLYVHLMEMSPVPEQALPVADQLRSLVPDAGHLVHMPTHIDVLCGDYKSTLEWNLRAIDVNEKYVAREGRVGFYALYHAHDRHFAIRSPLTPRSTAPRRR